MDLFLDDACLNTDILLAPDRDTWVRCTKTRAMFSAAIMAVVVLIIMVLVFFFATPGTTKVLMLLGCGAFLGILSISVALSGMMSGRDWDKLKVEQENLTAKDPEYKDWSKFVGYKRAQRAEATAQQMAQAQASQAKAQQGIAVAQLGNTALGVANFFKKA